jgi:hypothetical protein
MKASPEENKQARIFAKQVGTSASAVLHWMRTGLTDLTPAGLDQFKMERAAKRLHQKEIARIREIERKRAEWVQTTQAKKDAINARIRAYRATGEAKAKRRAYKKRISEERPILKVESALRARLVKFIRGNNKSGIRNLLGCSWMQFRRHLESQFTKGITWENYGTHWHIDHIIPCKAFDHSNPAQLRQCWHFSNLRPLSAKKNLAKGASIESPQLALLLPM